MRFLDHRAETNLENSGGAIAPGVPVQLIFWGDWWNGVGSNERAAITQRIKDLITSPYTSALDQYGIAPPTYRGSMTTTGGLPRPNGTLDDACNAAGQQLWSMIDGGTFAEPDEAGGGNAYFFFMPADCPLTADEDPAKHDEYSDWDGLWDIDWTWVGCISYYTANTLGNSAKVIDNITACFSHELVELCTNPESDAWHTTDDNQWEIGDICQPTGWETARVGDTQVMAYWSKRDQACIIPTYGLDAEIDGTLTATERIELGEGDVEYPFGEDSQLCKKFPACCMKGPYRWWRSQLLETVELTASSTGFGSAKPAWKIGGKPLSGGTTYVTTDVYRHQPNGTVQTTEAIPLDYKITKNGTLLTFSDRRGAGAFSVDVTATYSVRAKPSSAFGATRTAKITVGFSGDTISWDENYQHDLAACEAEFIREYLRTHLHLLVPARPGRPDPGPLRERNELIERTLPVAADPLQRRAVRYVLGLADQIEREEGPEAAAGIRARLLAGYGVTEPTLGFDTNNRAKG